jgi:hypothetical protein
MRFGYNKQADQRDQGGSEMTNDQINIAIAEACGWKYIAFNRGWVETGDGETQCVIPNYCNDLNAMHEAEKWMISNLRLLDFWQFAEELKRIVPANLGDDSYIHATARQRAEAFLKTIGKWEESHRNVDIENANIRKIALAAIMSALFGDSPELKEAAK